MIINIALFFAIMAYSIIVSQSFMYILALRDAQLKMGAANYIELRKLIDRNMQAKFRYVIYAALVTSLLLIPVLYVGGSAVLTVAALIAFSALLFDTFITIKGNLPINSAVNGWTVERYPANWQEMRAKWLRYFQYRQMLNITGFASLVAGAIFR